MLWFPMDTVEVNDARFRWCLPGNSALERLFGGMRWAEGPVWFADGEYLLVSDIPNDRMMRWVEGLGAAVFRQPSCFSNGNTRDRQGRLVTCEHGSRSVTRTEPDGRRTTLAASYRGRRLNSPNDVVVKSDGTLWFTDPTYGIIADYEGHKAPREQEGNYVFRLDPSTGELDVVADDFVQPNGLAFSPDESLLYVADTGASHDPTLPRHIRVFNVIDGRRLGGSRVFASLREGLYDGFRMDRDGNVWTSAGKGVSCYAPDGALLGRINVPEVVANVVFGGPRLNRLFIAATTSVYAIYTGQNGIDCFGEAR
jgi:gluconolactonase